MTPRWQLLAALCACAAPLACGPDVCETCGDGAPSSANASSTGSACTGTTGQLHGVVSNPDTPSPNAILDLRQKPSDVPIHAMADDLAAYSVELEAGSWIVGGESADGYCTTEQPKTVAIEACGDVELDVVLETCVL